MISIYRNWSTVLDKPLPDDPLILACDRTASLTRALLWFQTAYLRYPASVKVLQAQTAATSLNYIWCSVRTETFSVRNFPSPESLLFASAAVVPFFLVIP